MMRYACEIATTIASAAIHGWVAALPADPLISIARYVSLFVAIISGGASIIDFFRGALRGAIRDAIRDVLGDVRNLAREEAITLGVATVCTITGKAAQDVFGRFVDEVRTAQELLRTMRANPRGSSP